MCSALQVQERAVPSLIAAWPAAAAAVVRTYQAPAAGPLLLQYRVSAGAGLPGFSSPPSLVGLARPAAGAGRNVSTSLFCKNLRSAGLAAAGPSRAELELDILCQNTHADHSFVASDCFQKKTVSKKFVRGFEGRRAGSEPALRKRSRPAGCLQHLPPLLYSASLRSTPKLDCYWARHKKVSVLQYTVLRCFRSLQCPGR